MVRRALSAFFNLWFTIMDADRCAAAAGQNASGNPFRGAISPLQY